MRQLCGVWHNKGRVTQSALHLGNWWLPRTEEFFFRAAWETTKGIHFKSRPEQLPLHLC